MSHGPYCPYCKGPTSLVKGEQLLPHLAQVADRNYWACLPCDAYVACHEGTTTALGVPADRVLRYARRELHERYLDPLWRNAHELPHYSRKGVDERFRADIARVARDRVYAWLAHRLGIPEREAHVALFDLDTCLSAQRHLHGMSYARIRAWAQRSAKQAKAMRRAARESDETTLRD